MSRRHAGIAGLLYLVLGGAALAGAAPEGLSQADLARTVQSAATPSVGKRDDGRLHLVSAMQDLEAQLGPEGLSLQSREEGGQARFALHPALLGRAEAAGKRLPAGMLSLRGELARLDRGAVIEEVSSSSEGIRQDFVLPSRPPGEGALWLELVASGARISDIEGGDGRAVALRLDDRRRLHYRGLQVIDAAGKTLPARMRALGGERIRIEVSDADARYPVRIDPVFSDADWTALEKPAVNSASYAIAVADNGDVYVGGAFTQPAKYLARWNGSAWSAVGGDISGSAVLALSYDSVADRLYVGGVFTAVGGMPASNIASWDGSGWSALGTGVNSPVEVLAFDPVSQSLYAGGNFTSAGGSPANRVARWNGTAWSALGSGVNNVVTAMAFDSVGQGLYVGGYFSSAGGSPALGVARWDGTAWSALGSGVSSVLDLAFDAANQRLYVGGFFSDAGGTPASRVAMWNGASWSALGSGTNDAVWALQFDPVEQRLYAGGDFTSAGGSPANRLAAWDGSAWTAVGAGLSSTVLSLGRDPASGRLYIGGQFLDSSSGARSIAQWDGSSISALGSRALDALYAMAWDATRSRLYVGGDFRHASSGPASRVAVWDGSSWSGLGAGLDGTVRALALDEVGNRLYAGGEFTQAGGAAANRVARWDGSNWSALGSGTDAAVRALTWDADNGRLYAGGLFSTAGGNPAAKVAQWDGSVWSALGSGISGEVYSLAWDGPRNRLYAGGTFSSAGGAPASNIALWSAGAWSALGSGLQSSTPSVNALAVNPANGDLYAGGSFERSGNQSANSVARWNGSTWSGLGQGVENSGSPGFVHGLAWDATSQRLYVGGLFNTAGGGRGANYVSAWTGNGWSLLGGGTIGQVQALALDQAGRRLFVGGFLTQVGSIPAVVGAAQLNRPPQFAASPAISGSGAFASTLTLTGASSSDPDGDTVILAVRWQRDGIDIPGATASSYTVGTADIGHSLRAVLTLSDGEDTVSRTTAAVIASKASQSISFAALPDRSIGTPPFTLSATGGNSGNPVTFAAETPAVCAVSGTFGATVSLLAAGTCTIRAIQLGDLNYQPAPAVDRSFQVAAALSNLALSSSQAVVNTSEPLTLTAEVSGVQPTGVVSFRDGGAAIPGCSEVQLVNIDGNRLATCTTSSLAAGTRNLSASYPGDSRHLPSSGNLSQRINARPALNQPSDLLLLEDQASAPIPLNVSDAETSAAALGVVAGSSNPTLVTDAMLAAGLSGTGGSRSLVVTPAPNRSGGASITLDVSDADGATTRRTFLLNVIPVNDAPTLALAGNRFHPAGSSGTFEAAPFASADVGPFETGQTLSYSVQPLYNPQQRVSGVAIDASGRLVYSLGGDSGAALFAVVARDDGGTSNGGSDRSPARLFRILVGNGANIAVQIRRTQPNAAQLSAAMKGGATQASYEVEVTNHGPDAASNLLLTVPLPLGLNSVLWTCTAPTPCRPGNGSDAVSTRLDLAAGQSAVIELLGAIDGSQRFLEIVASAALPEGVSPLSTGEERNTFIEPIGAASMYRNGFE